jgi:biotin-(acetyl-CoA carboxylase) ligase
LKRLVPCEICEEHLSQLQEGHFNEIRTKYLESIFRFNEKALFEIQGVQQEACIVDVTEQGLLVLKFDNETMQAFDLKEVKMLF